MGYASVYVVPPAALAALRRFPSVLDLLDENEGELESLQAMAETAKPSEYSWASPAELRGFLAEPGVGALEWCLDGPLDLDAYWTAVHFLLAKENAWRALERAGAPAPPVAAALIGGTPLARGSDATVREPPFVREIAKALKPLAPKTLRARLRGGSAEAGDPEIWDPSWDADEILDRAKELRSLYLGAADDGNAVLVRIGS